MNGSSARSGFYSMLIHGAAIVLVLLATRNTSRIGPAQWFAPRDTVFLPGSFHPGGGGGQRDPAPASKGILPSRARRIFVPPVNRILNPDPVLPMAPAILAPEDVPVRAIDIAVFGDPHGMAGQPSGGPGGGFGIGAGDGPGVGGRRGPGYGVKDGPGVTGSGRIAGALTAPVLLWKTEPMYSDEARRAKIQGSVVLYVEIDATGRPRNIRVRQSLGFGLDDRAAEAVAQWRFRPASRNGKPEAAGALVEVNFRLL